MDLWLLLAVVVAVLAVLYATVAPVKWWAKSAFYALSFFPICLMVIIHGVLIRRLGHWRNFYFGSRCYAHLARWMGVRVYLRNAKNFTRSFPVIFMGNHQTSLDMMVLFCALPKRVSFLAKSTLRWLGPLGIGAMAIGCIFLHRKDRSRAIGEMSRAATEMFRRSVSIFTFPEGTRNWRRGSPALLPFKKGCFHLAIDAGVPIVPVVTSSYRGFHQDFEYWYNNGTVLIDVLEPIPTKGYSKENLDELIKLVEKRMLDSFNELQKKLAEVEKGQLGDFVLTN